MSVSVQFGSAGQALAAFNKVDAEVWALWQSKKLIFKGNGSDELSQFLQMLEDSQLSAAVYTLCYYEGVEDKKEVNSKTPYDGSFSFVLSEEAEEIRAARSHRRERGGLMESRLSAIEEKLDRLAESPPDDDNESGGLGMVGKILNHPTIQQVLPLIMQKFFGAPVAPLETANLARLSGPPVSNQAVNLGGFVDQHPAPAVPSIVDSVGLLAGLDPKLKERVYKLAWAAQNDPGSYNTLMGLIDSYAIPG